MTLIETNYEHVNSRGQTAQNAPTSLMKPYYLSITSTIGVTRGMHVGSSAPSVDLVQGDSESAFVTATSGSYVQLSSISTNFLKFTKL